jgi:hypothetical protein
MVLPGGIEASHQVQSTPREKKKKKREEKERGEMGSRRVEDSPE